MEVKRKYWKNQEFRYNELISLKDFINSDYPNKLFPPEQEDEKELGYILHNSEGKHWWVMKTWFDQNYYDFIDGIEVEKRAKTFMIEVPISLIEFRKKYNKPSFHPDPWVEDETMGYSLYNEELDFWWVSFDWFIKTYQISKKGRK